MQVLLVADYPGFVFRDQGASIPLAELAIGQVDLLGIRLNVEITLHIPVVADIHQVAHHTFLLELSVVLDYVESHCR